MLAIKGKDQEVVHWTFKSGPIREHEPPRPRIKMYKPEPNLDFGFVYAWPLNHTFSFIKHKSSSWLRDKVLLNHWWWTKLWDDSYLLKLLSQAFTKKKRKMWTMNDRRVSGDDVALLRKKIMCLSRRYGVFSLSVSLVNSHGGRASPRLCSWITMSRRGGRLTNFNPRWHPGLMWDLPSVPSPHPTFSCPMPFSRWMELPFPLASLPWHAFTIAFLTHITLLFFSLPSLLPPRHD